MTSNLRSVAENIRKGDQAVSLDLKVAYQYVPILLCFSFQGKCNQFGVECVTKHPESDTH